MAKVKKTKSPISIKEIPASISCLKARKKTEALLLRQCKKKSKHLSPCCKCNPKFKGPKIRLQKDAVLLNTAYNGSGGTVPPPNQDMFWERSSTLNGTYSPAIVSGNPIPGSWSGIPPVNSDWLSINSKAKARAQDVFYKLKFSICESINPHDFKLNVNFLVDDRLIDIYVNGVKQSTKVSIPAGGFRSSSNVKLEHDWKHCENEIIFHTNSSATYLGFIAGFTLDRIPLPDLSCKCKCRTAELPKIAPCFSVSWGKIKKDELNTTDCETLCITACNCYSNVTFKNLSIPQIIICDENGKPVSTGSNPKVEAIPFGPICFGDLGPCKPGKRENCISRQIVLKSNNAKPGYYKLKFGSVCYDIVYSQSTEACFEFELIKG